MRKKILFVIGTLERGGAELQMVALIEGLRARGFDCRVFVLDETGPLRSRLLAAGVIIHSANHQKAVSSAGRMLAVARGLTVLMWTALRWRPAVIHAYLPLTNVMCAIVGRLAFVPLIITSRRALGTHQDRRPLWRPLDRLANRLSHAITCNSIAVGRDAIDREQVAPSRLVLIRNGLDFSRFEVPVDRQGVRQALGLTDDDRAIVVVANLIPYKGHHDLIDALGLIIPRLTAPLNVFLVGRDDGARNEIEQRAERLRVRQFVHFLGPREDVPTLLRAMDLFVLPSHEEGSSNALLEAMAAGVPVIATDVGGNGEALCRGRYGLLVPPKNAEAMASAISAALVDPVSARDRSIQAKTFVKSQYGLDHMVETYVRLYAGDRVGSGVVAWKCGKASNCG